ncbi:MAG: helicase-related protein [Thermoproteota archaeon]
MELSIAVKTLITNVLNQLSYHPLFAPYLKTSTENPPQYYLHQCEVIAKLAVRKPIRVLIGDEIGLGKTITAIAIAKYLEITGRAKRFLIIVPRVLVLQWRKELIRMGVPTSKIKSLESKDIEFYSKQGFPEGYFIASMDLLKREERISKIIDVDWDLIIVDEVHKFGYNTERFKEIGKKLIESKPFRNVIFLSATPHRGDPKDYIQRLQLLDPYLVKGWKNLDKRRFYEVTHGSILFRRTKEDVNNVYEKKKVFMDARFYATLIAGREEEKEFIKELVTFLRTKLIEFTYEKGLIDEKIIPLLVILIFKRATSSPYSAWTTFRRLLQRLLLKRVEQKVPNELVESVNSFLDVGYEDFEYEKDPEEIFNDFLDRASSLLNDNDKEKIKELRDMAKSIIERGDTKLNATISLLEDIMEKTDSKVIVFTEYKDTLDYIVDNLKKRHPEWSQSILSLSSKETQDEKLFNKVRNDFEKDPKARILVATDVIAEGVNLQVANIVINYEIPWSLIKLEQRIGRVWRLGQKKDVEAYTLFMDNIADKAALNSMYQKLLNLKRAELQPRPITGQEVLFYYAEAKDIAEITPSIPLTKEKKKFVKVTEATSIRAYLEKDKEGLEKLVNSIIATKQEIERKILSKGVLYKPRSREEVEKTIQQTGFKDHEEIFQALKNLLRASAPMLGLFFVEEDGRIKIWKEKQMPTSISNLDGFYAILADESSTNEVVSIVARGEDEALISLIPILVKDRKDGSILYRDLIGVDTTHAKILRGSSLLNIISKAISNCIGAEKILDKSEEIPNLIVANIIDETKNRINELLDAVEVYTSRLENYELREKENTWIKKSDIDVKTSDAIGYLHFVKVSTNPPESLPEDVKKKIERLAIEKVLEIEKAEGRSPILMPETEHYDIMSINQSTGEVRLIEVKGHKGLEIYAELTEDEARVAEKEKDRYWVYIVYDIESGQPKMLRFQNPLKTMDIQVFERVQKRYILRPKDPSEV